jgi:hypothetical protein
MIIAQFPSWYGSVPGFEKNTVIKVKIASLFFLLKLALYLYRYGYSSNNWS